MSNISMFTIGNAFEASGAHGVNSQQETNKGCTPALDGFDFVWALQPTVVNRQLATLQHAGFIPWTVAAGGLEETGLLIGGDGDDRAVLAAPEIHFETGMPRTAALVLTFINGNMRIPNGYEGGDVLRQPLAGWRLAFQVKIQLLPVSMRDLLNGAAPAGPASVNRLGRFDEAYYRVQAAMLDFEQSDLQQADALYTYLNTDNEFLAKRFTATVGEWLKQFAGSGNPFVLGYVVTRKTHADDILDRMQPSGANVAANGSLNFLQVMGDRKIAHDPRLYGVSAGHFPPAAPRNEDSAGKLVIARNTFLNDFVRPLLVEPIRERLASLPDYIHARRAHGDELDRVESANEKSGAMASLDNGARAGFVPEAGGWRYRDHVLLHWHEAGERSHDRESEQDWQFHVGVSNQPDADGVERLTFDLTSTLMRYEWDRLNQKSGPFMRKTYLGKGWARTTMQWSLRLQCVPTARGGITLTVNGRPAPAVTDSGVVGMYVVSDARSHLLNMNKITMDWEGNAASMTSLQQTVVAHFGAAVAAMFGQAAGHLVLPAGPQLAYRGVRLDGDGNIELELVHEER
ncbi:hypothetical protein GJ700_23830 [Duganella sp. FT92W]|uniref:Uncharacterized protein n=1 Tax=Pseudoduganella rivuli TaxID=2666085 RepID=A0A7X2LW33_9BURK|nr:hypothetical protein [Pseudoduganella rivuli]MRV74747.1 hypothetical protein [Pseudoduganella rivuli]